MLHSQDVLQKFESWYKSLKPMKQYGGRPAKGTIAAALVVLDRLREECDLDFADHLAPGGAQIAGLNLPALRKILARFGESREFPSEGGRTNRGNNTPVRELLDALRAGGLGKLDKSQRSVLIDSMQEALVRSLSAYYDLERIRFDFDTNKPASIIVGLIMAKAKERHQSGAVAQHLVGAKLAIRFPSKKISNFAFSAADDQGGRAGDFQVGKTAFHVTVAPGKSHIARCVRNLRDGLAVFVLVDEANVVRASSPLKNPPQ